MNTQANTQANSSGKVHSSEPLQRLAQLEVQLEAIFDSASAIEDETFGSNSAAFLIAEEIRFTLQECLHDRLRTIHDEIAKGRADIWAE